MPLLEIGEPQRTAERRRADLAAAGEQARRRRHLLLLLVLAGWALVGLVLMALAMATTDQARGEGLFAAGLALGYGGMVLSLLVAFVRAAERGEV